MKRDFRLPFINIDEDGIEHVTYQPSALEEDKPYYIHWNNEDWAIIKRNDHIDWYKKEKRK